MAVLQIKKQNKKIKINWSNNNFNPVDNVLQHNNIINNKKVYFCSE